MGIKAEGRITTSRCLGTKAVFTVTFGSRVVVVKDRNADVPPVISLHLHGLSEESIREWLSRLQPGTLLVIQSKE